MRRLLASLVIAVPLLTQAQDVDPSTLYSLSTEGSSRAVKAGGRGTFVLAIAAHPGAHVSDEAPLKLTLSGTGVAPEKSSLSLADSVEKRPSGQATVSPRFEVPFVGTAAGAGKVDAKLTFFICTATICARQQKTLSVPVAVN